MESVVDRLALAGKNVLSLDVPAMGWLNQLVASLLVDHGLQPPALRAGPDSGTVCAVWTFPDWEVAALIDPGRRRVTVNATDALGGRQKETFDGGEPGWRSEVAAFIRRFDN